MYAVIFRFFFYFST
ncbi:pheST operon leader peptide PheM [Providencia rettgeri]